MNKKKWYGIWLVLFMCIGMKISNIQVQAEEVEEAPMISSGEFMIQFVYPDGTLSAKEPIVIPSLPGIVGQEFNIDISELFTEKYHLEFISIDAAPNSNQDSFLDFYYIKSLKQFMLRGTITEAPQTYRITVKDFYPAGNVYVHHLDENNHEILAGQVVLAGEIGETYVEKSVNQPGYRFTGRILGEASVVFKKEEQQLIFYYESMPDTTITIHYVEKNQLGLNKNKELAEAVEITGKYNETVSLKDYVKDFPNYKLSKEPSITAVFGEKNQDIYFVYDCQLPSSGTSNESKDILESSNHTTSIEMKGKETIVSLESIKIANTDLALVPSEEVLNRREDKNILIKQTNATAGNSAVSSSLVSRSKEQVTEYNSSNQMLPATGEKRMNFVLIVFYVAVFLLMATGILFRKTQYKDRGF